MTNFPMNSAGTSRPYLSVTDRHKIGRFLEAPIHTGKTHVSHVVDLAQPFHDQLPDEFGGHFTPILIRYRSAQNRSLPGSADTHWQNARKPRRRFGATLP